MATAAEISDPRRAAVRAAATAPDSFRPVFIMGPHRSGTTILYRVLAETGQFNVTTAYHVINRARLGRIRETGGEAAARLELSARFASLGLSDRQFDAMPVDPDLPEEYAWVLPRPGRRPRLGPGNLAVFLDFCHEVARAQDPARPLLLKNPHDAANFLYIRDALPSARFVFIHRDPVAVINSQVKAVRSLLRRKNEYVALVVPRYRRLCGRPRLLRTARWLYSSRWPVLVQQASATVRDAAAAFVRHREQLGSSALDVTYPDLCRHPVPTVAAILRFLGLPEAPAVGVESLLAPRESPLLEEVSARKERIRRRNRGYCHRFGFEG